MSPSAKTMATDNQDSKASEARGKREFLAALRRRNVRQLQMAAGILSVAMPLFTVMDYLTIAQRDGTAVRDWYVRLDLALAFFFWGLFIVSFRFRKIFKRFVALFWVLGSLALIGAQVFLLWQSGKQAPYILLVEILGVAAFVHFRRSYSILYLSCLVALGSVLFFLQVYPFLQIIPPLLAVFVAGTVIIFLRDRLARQAVEIAEKNRRLSVNNRRLQVARRETDRILRNVREALFILGPDFRIGTQASAAAGVILDVSETAGRDFSELMRGLLTEEKYEDTMRFLRMMFQANRKESVLARTNPLQRISVHLGTTRHLAFRFHRIRENKRIIGLMTTVLDETELRLEQEALAEKEAESRRRSRILMDILRVPPELLRKFLHDAQGNLNFVREALQGLRPLNKTEIFRRAHTLKGNAQSLDLEAFAGTAHEFEELLADQATSVDALATKLESLTGFLREIEAVLERMADFQDSFQRDTPGLLLKSIHGLIERQAQAAGKQVRLNTEAIAPGDVPESHEHLLRDVLVQLARNSIAHGIDTPEKRAAAGKPPEGLITIALEKEPTELRLIYRDDGRGLDPEKLKQTAQERGLRSAAEIDAMDGASALKLIFESGLSTAENLDQAAGRGVGMDVVRAGVQRAGGRIEIASRTGEFCEFRIRLPLGTQADDN